MWFIHGKKYDLTNFIAKHPGGRQILEKSKNLEDSSALFETYHAFSNREYIMKELQKYEVKEDIVQDGTKDIYIFDSYHQLTNEVKSELKLTRTNIKANNFWIVKNIFFLMSYLYFMYSAFLSNMNFSFQLLSGLISGVLLSVLGFNVMHDGLHFALFCNTNLNWVFGSIVNDWLLWNPTIWFYHHTYAHHSYTGDEHKDPDMRHLRPVARKYFNDNKILRSVRKIQHYLVTIFSCIFPGFSTGQALAYLISNNKKKYLVLNCLTIYINFKI